MHQAPGQLLRINGINSLIVGLAIDELIWLTAESWGLSARFGYLTVEHAPLTLGHAVKDQIWLSAELWGLEHVSTISHPNRSTPILQK